MAAGYAGLSRLFTPEAADALFARGEALRAALNGVSRGRMEWTGLGSLMSAHFGGGAEDAAARELFFLDMLERGFYLARRGMVALSLEIGEAETQRFTAAVAEFAATHAAVL